ncbi:MAG TPA: PEP-CTERM sorting domain-containing protein [Pirellulales bacterium]|nr:PEP-CTERM sorting domain-containing protein [Pirellulales bacterium]
MLSMYRFLMIGAAPFVSFLIVSIAHGVTLQPGDVVVGVDLGTGKNPDFALLEIDPATGNRTVISDNSIGTGPSLYYNYVSDIGIDFPAIPYISYQADGSLLVTVASPNSSTGSALLRVDPATGDRTLVSDELANSGPPVYYVAARDFGNSILVGGPQGTALIDPATGNRTAFSAVNVSGFAIDGSNIYAASADQASVYAINASTGTPTLISGQGVGTGPDLHRPQDVALNSAGNLLVLDGHTVYNVDPITGDRTIISSDAAGSTVGTGPDLLVGAFRLAVAPDGTIFTTGFMAPDTVSIASIDPLTGNRTIISDATIGTGPIFNLTTAVSGIMVVPNVPEPSTLALAALGGLLLVAWQRRK